MLRLQVLEVGIGRESHALQVLLRRVEDEGLVGAHLIRALVELDLLGPQRAVIRCPDHHDVAPPLHVPRPVHRPLAGGQGGGLPAIQVVERDVHVLELDHLRVGIGIRGIGQHPGPADAFRSDVSRHVEQDLVGGIRGGDGRGRLDAFGTPKRRRNEKNHEEREGESYRDCVRGNRRDARRPRTPRPDVFPARPSQCQPAPAFMRSCKWTIPTTFRESSSTGSAMIPCFSITRTAAPARSVATVVLGDFVITSATLTSRNVSVFSMSRVRSPAVTTPASVPPPFTTATVPRRSARSTTHSRIGRSRARSGRSVVTITSPTRRSSERPNVPPGCRAAKSSRVNPFTSSSVTARASPIASATVVLVVGASVSAQASSSTPPSRTTAAARPSGESATPVMAMIGTPSRPSWPTSPNRSSDAPLFDSRIATSCAPAIPRSPCRESTGWMNDAGVPVEVSVAAIFRAINPDFPTPETMTRPGVRARSPTARPNAAESVRAEWASAPASSSSTRRPRSTSRDRSLGAIAPLHQVRCHALIPHAARLENDLRRFAGRPASALGLRDDGREGPHFGTGVPHRDGQPDALQDRDVGQVVAHEGALFEGEVPGFQPALERRELLRSVVLNDIRDAELARPERGRLRHPAADDDDGEPRPLEHLEPQAVRHVEALELRGVVGHETEIHAAVGQHAIHIEPDDREVPGDSGVDHETRTASRAARHTSIATSRVRSIWSRGSMFGPSEGAWSGSGCVSMKNPSAPAAAAA